jgi:6-phosphofructokinase 1
MVTLQRVHDSPYRCTTGVADLAAVANYEKPLPREWIGLDGFSVTEAFIRYARPLIQGDVNPPTKDGLPHFMRFERHFIGE